MCLFGIQQSAMPEDAGLRLPISHAKGVLQG